MIIIFTSLPGLVQDTSGNYGPLEHRSVLQITEKYDVLYCVRVIWGRGQNSIYPQIAINNP